MTHPDLDLYVTWPGLENCLKGLRDALDSVKQREDELAAAMLTPRASVIPPPAPIEQKFTQTVRQTIIYSISLSLDLINGEVINF